MNIKYSLSLVTGVLECLLFSGILFGWASLRYVLQVDGYFDLCKESNETTVQRENASLTTQSSTTEELYNITTNVSLYSTVNPLYSTSLPHETVSSNKTEENCNPQSEKLNLVFTIASTLLSFSTLLNGYIYDTYGTWVARVISVVIFTLGGIMMTVSSPDTSWLLFPSMTFFAIGGILLLVTNLQVGNLFGKFRSSVITLMSGALDSSSFVFLIFKMLHESGIALTDIFHFITWCSVLLWLRTFLLLPKKHIPFPINKGYDYGIADCKCRKKALEPKEMTLVGANETINVEEKEALTTESEKDMVAKNVPPAFTYIKTSLFWGNAIHFSLLQLRNYFFMSSLYEWLKVLAGDKVSSYLDIFGICQLFGIFFAPLNGILIDGVSRVLSRSAMDPGLVPLRAVTFSAIATSTLGILFSIIIVIPSLPLQYVSFILQVIFRSFLYGGNMSFIASAFPGQHFGKLYGLTMFIGGAIALLQYPLFTLVLRQMDGDFFIMNIVFVFVSMLTLLHPFNVYRWCKNRASAKKKSIVRDAAGTS